MSVLFLIPFQDDDFHRYHAIETTVDEEAFLGFMQLFLATKWHSKPEIGFEKFSLGCVEGWLNFYNLLLHHHGMGLTGGDEDRINHLVPRCVPELYWRVVILLQSATAIRVPIIDGQGRVVSLRRCMAAHLPDHHPMSSFDADLGTKDHQKYFLRLLTYAGPSSELDHPELDLLLDAFVGPLTIYSYVPKLQGKDGLDKPFPWYPSVVATQAARSLFIIKSHEQAKGRTLSGVIEAFLEQKMKDEKVTKELSCFYYGDDDLNLDKPMEKNVSVRINYLRFQLFDYLAVEKGQSSLATLFQANMPGILKGRLKGSTKWLLKPDSNKLKDAKKEFDEWKEYKGWANLDHWMEPRFNLAYDPPATVDRLGREDEDDSGFKKHLFFACRRDSSETCFMPHSACSKGIPLKFLMMKNLTLLLELTVVDEATAGSLATMIRNGGSNAVPKKTWVSSLPESKSKITVSCCSTYPQLYWADFRDTFPKFRLFGKLLTPCLFSSHG